MAGKIVIVDDEHDVITYLETLFKDNGYEVATAMDGKEGLEKIREFRPDLITLDIIMPNQSGVGLYRELKKDETLQNIPVIILSGVNQYKKFFARDHHSVPKPDAFVEKPFDKSELLELIKQLIG
jgi:CheY-like chemotaxis protein